jgi:hypothetical protein
MRFFLLGSAPAYLTISECLPVVDLFNIMQQ